MRHFDLILQPVPVLLSSDALSRLVPAPPVDPTTVPIFASGTPTARTGRYYSVFFAKFVQILPMFSSLRHNHPR
jgi:hypothetical protein